jgi:ABC-type glycerol-3-phosphate transport system substrate-binding protein
MASKHPAEGWEWVKWTCSAEFSKTRALAKGGGPIGMASVWHDEELLTKYPPWREWAAVMDEVGPNYNAANLRGKEVEDAFNQGASAIMTEEMSVEEGLSSITKEVQKILDKSIAI